MNNWVKNIGIWLVIGIVLMMVFMQVTSRSGARPELEYTAMMQEAKNGNIESIKQEGSRTLRVTMRDSKTFTTFTPAGGDPFMSDVLRKSGVKGGGKPEDEQWLLMSIFISWFPMLLKSACGSISCARCKVVAKAAHFRSAKAAQRC